MKTLKLTIIALFVAGLGLGTVSAQTADKAATATPATTQHLKKDGTPDMRYKDNKMKATPTVNASTMTAKPAVKPATATKAKAAKATSTTTTK